MDCNKLTINRFVAKPCPSISYTHSILFYSLMIYSFHSVINSQTEIISYAKNLVEMDYFGKAWKTGLQGLNKTS